jgi:hypothetical protein
MKLNVDGKTMLQERSPVDAISSRRRSSTRGKWAKSVGAGV